MPTKTFLNLTPEKQQLLLKAAKQEFKERTLIDSSINKIIREASIPRGSFYQYFIDKEDLYFYILKLEKQQVIKDILKIIETEQEIPEILIKIYDFLYNYIIQSNDEKYYKNVIITIQKLEDKKDIKEQLSNEKIYKTIKEKTNYETETLEDLLYIFSVYLGKTLIESLQNKNQQQQIRTRFVKTLHIINNGLKNYKEVQV